MTRTDRVILAALALYLLGRFAFTAGWHVVGAVLRARYRWHDTRTQTNPVSPSGSRTT